MQWVLNQRAVPRRLMLIPLITLVLALSLLTARSSRGQVVGGPVVILGIDAEDSSGNGHGPTSTYVALTNGILANVLNSGAGILVIGGGKLPAEPDDVTGFWTAIGAAIPAHPVTFVNDETAPGSIAARSFAGFALIVVASSFDETPYGGLTAAENTALVTRADDIAAFVDGGGGVLGFTQTGFASPYLYLGGIGGFVATTGLEFSNITATAEGTQVGITDALDVCCWHDELSQYPSFLMPLATNAASGNVVAVGGSRVTFDSTTTSTSSSSSTSSSTIPGSSTSSTSTTLGPGVTTTPTTRPPATTTTLFPGTLIQATSTTVRTPTATTVLPRAPRLTG